MNKKVYLSLFLSLLITLGAVLYQRMTGPTYPKKFHLQLGTNEMKVALPRSQGGSNNCLIEIPNLNYYDQGIVYYRQYPSTQPWQVITMLNTKTTLRAELPNQPPAGKLAYYVTFAKSGDENLHSLASKEDPVVVRFKGEVPLYILIPHIVSMFLSILIAVFAGIEAILKTSRYYHSALYSFALLTLGGLILGPIVQKLAFGQYWTGFPNGYDLTDNKVLISFIVWLIALIVYKVKRIPLAIIVAAVLQVAVYVIPHSAWGSQLDYSTMKVETGPQ